MTESDGPPGGRKTAPPEDSFEDLEREIRMHSARPWADRLRALVAKERERTEASEQKAADMFECAQNADYDANELRAELSRLRAELDIVHGDRKRMCAEIERLRGENERARACLRLLTKQTGIVPVFLRADVDAEVERLRSEASKESEPRFSDTTSGQYSSKKAEHPPTGEGREP